MLSFIFWNICGMDHVASDRDVYEWVSRSSVFSAQETMQHRAFLQLPEKTPFIVPARKPVGPGRPSGGLASYFDNGYFGAATFTKLSDENYFLCVRVSLPGLSFIVGNVYLPLNSPGVDDDIVQLFEAQFTSILELYPNDPIICGGDFNCHVFTTSNRPHELMFKDLVRRLHVNGFAVFPVTEAPFTYRLEKSYSTIDYVFVRGMVTREFRVALEFADVTSHRPLILRVDTALPVLTRDVVLHPALGAAYLRSSTKADTLRDLLTGLAADDRDQNDLPSSSIQQLYDRIENSFELCTKRTRRKPFTESWESELDPDDVATLATQRAYVRSIESKLSPSSPDVDYEALTVARELLSGLQTELKKKAVALIAERHRREARHHAATWKLLSSLGDKRVQPEIPPSAVYDHYRQLSQVAEAPLTADEVPQLFVGPLTQEDAALEADVSPDEARAALDDINLQSAPGPDGLPARLVRSAFNCVLMLTFLARLLTRCFRAAFVPSQWRTSENFVLYKGVGPSTVMSSFRAISLTSSFAKVHKMFLLYFIFIYSALFAYFVTFLESSLLFVDSRPQSLRYTQ